MMILHTVEPTMTVFYVSSSTRLIDKTITNLKRKTFSALMNQSVTSFESGRASMGTQLLAEIERVRMVLLASVPRDRWVASLPHFMVSH